MDTRSNVIKRLDTLYSTDNRQRCSSEMFRIRKRIAEYIVYVLSVSVFRIEQGKIVLEPEQQGAWGYVVGVVPISAKSFYCVYIIVCDKYLPTKIGIIFINPITTVPFKLTHTK